MESGGIAAEMRGSVNAEAGVEENIQHPTSNIQRPIG
jgi:hypothetical protein